MTPKRELIAKLKVLENELLPPQRTAYAVCNAVLDHWKTGCNCFRRLEGDERAAIASVLIQYGADQSAVNDYFIRQA